MRRNLGLSLHRPFRLLPDGKGSKSTTWKKWKEVSLSAVIMVPILQTGRTLPRLLNRRQRLCERAHRGDSQVTRSQHGWWWGGRELSDNFFVARASKKRKGGFSYTNSLIWMQRISPNQDQVQRRRWFNLRRQNYVLLYSWSKLVTPIIRTLAWRVWSALTTMHSVFLRLKNTSWTTQEAERERGRCT
jgi:hypothetical protein